MFRSRNPITSLKIYSNFNSIYRLAALWQFIEMIDIYKCRKS